MRPLVKTIYALALMSFGQAAHAQTQNWSALENAKHIVHVGVGWDYSLTYRLGYAYQFQTKWPVLLNADMSVPSGENLLDDFKAKAGGQVVLLNMPNVKGSVMLNGIYRRYENPMVRMQSFGSDVKGAIGYYRPRWFVAGEMGFDKAIVTHFRHSELYREYVYTDVQDGWYAPPTGGNVQYGMQAGFSMKKSDVTLNMGKVITEDFKTTPLIPFYLMFGYNYRIH